MFKCALPLVALLLTSCALQRAQEAADARTQMVGMPQEQVLACMGPPVNRAAAGATEVWSYNSGNGRQTVNVVAQGTAVSTARSCTVNVTMVNSRVNQINYLGPTGGLLTEGEQCAFAIRACVPPR